MSAMPCRSRVAAAACLLLGALLAGSADALPSWDFEGGDLQGWTITEGAFGRLVCDRATFRNTGATYNKQGLYYLTTVETEAYTGYDPFTGSVESPVFAIDAPYLSFLVGGGQGGGVHIDLRLEPGGRVVRQARGRNDETMDRHVWDLREFEGAEARMVIVDREIGGWGHVTLDDIRPPTDAEASSLPLDAVTPDLSGPVRASYASLWGTLTRLHETYGAGFAAYEELRAEARALRARVESGDERVATAVEALARRAFLTHPALSGRTLLYVVRAQYVPDHHNTETMFQTGEINTGSFRGGGALRVLDLATGASRSLLELPEGMVRDPDVSWDATRVLVSIRRGIADDYHLAEVSVADGSLRELTAASGVTDIDPLYLPDGGIVFTSTREPKFCGCNRHIMGNLFRIGPDGGGIQQIGKSTLHEGHGALLPDGRVLYDRWEYVDRNFGDAQGLWTCNPDGTQHAVYWGNNTPSPGAVLDAHALPGSPGRFISVFGSCHDRPWGALALVDRNLAIDGKPPVVRTWPTEAIDRVMVGDFDAFIPVWPKYEDPWPLDDDTFLCSRMMPGEGERMGIYVVDTAGSEALLHAEGPGCFDPMLLQPRPAPPAIPDRVSPGRPTGRVYIADVYRGSGMEIVERGSVAQVRVVEVPEKRFWTQEAWPGQGQEAPAMAWHDFNAKRILGTAPVRSDGSAYLEVPADRFVYFQLLDSEGRMVQSMRSGTIVRPGETLGCGGCHESRLESVANRGVEGFRGGADALEPWYGPERDFSYTAEVQPVWDRNCVSCHDYGKPAGERLNLSGDLVLAFNVSYDELWRKGYLSAIGAGPASVQAPRSWGSPRSKLVETLRQGHGEVALTPEEWDRVVTWVDLNAPYYPSYASDLGTHLYGRSPLTPAEIARLEELSGEALARGGLRTEPDPWVNFTRPELSPLLARIPPEGREEALALVRAGVRRLAEAPRPDMPGWRLAGIDAERERKYERLAGEVRGH